MAAAVIPSPAFKFPFDRGSKTHLNPFTSLALTSFEATHITQLTGPDSVPSLLDCAHSTQSKCLAPPQFPAAGASPCIDYSTTQQKKPFPLLRSVCFKMQQWVAYFSGVSTISPCLTQQRCSRCWPKALSRKTWTHSSILTFYSGDLFFFTHSSYLWLNLPEELTCESLSQDFVSTRLSLPKSPPSAAHPLCISQTSCTKKNHLFKLPPPLNWVVCAYALHMILISLPASLHLHRLPPQCQFDKITFWGNMSLIVPTASFFMHKEKKKKKPKIVLYQGKKKKPKTQQNFYRGRESERRSLSQWR